MSMLPKSKDVYVPYVGLIQQHHELKSSLLSAVERVLDHSSFILGEEVEAFEREFAKYCGTKYAVGVGNGTDALILALRAAGIGPGDEVITAPNSFIASASSIAMVGARPVFVDVGDDYNMNANLLETSITSRTKAIIPVHLTGRPSNMDIIMAIAEQHGLIVIEDAAQAVGAKFNGKPVGSFGMAGCFSFHPLKNLNACGDGGIITTNDTELHMDLIKYRNHGLRTRDEVDWWGPNSRLDAIQAAMLMVKMEYLNGWTDIRRNHAQFYRKRLSEWVVIPPERETEFSVYHTFVIQCDRRDELMSHLENRGVETKIHYPVPIHLQEASRELGYKLGDFPVTEEQAKSILSLPIYPELEQDQLELVANSIQSFYTR